MKDPEIQSGRMEKVAAGWFNGANSVRNPWLLPDTQYQWGVNIVNRGGVVQTRPGYRLKLTLPPGNLQGLTFFEANKDDGTAGEYLVFCVDGKVYYTPFPLVQPTNWDAFRLKSVSFNPLAKQIYWCVCEKSIERTTSDSIALVPTYKVLIMQDGIRPSAYWDGTTDGTMDETSPARQTPIGTWMAYSGGRLWVARGNAVIASDLLNPTSFIERTEDEGRGDWRVDGEISGLGLMLGESRQNNLIVFTKNSTSGLLSSIQDRETWFTTSNFQFMIYPELGCIAGRSIISHAGLLWWYSSKGLVANDSAVTSYITSQIKYKDVEMAITKRNMAPDLTGICGASFESYLMMSVPSGDTLNAHTMVLDYAIADELTSDSEAAWNSVWTGTRPVQWAKGYVSDDERIFFASVDYNAVPNSTSFNHIWEAFQSDRMDTVEYLDEAGALQVEQNSIYCQFMTKYFGDGLDIKRFVFAEANILEIAGQPESGDIYFKVSYCGLKGVFKEIFNSRINAMIDPGLTANSELKALFDAGGSFRKQSRLIRTQTPNINTVSRNVESPYTENLDSRFCLLLEWCGRAAVDSLRIYMEPKEETASGACTADEDEIRVLTQNGDSYFF